MTWTIPAALQYWKSKKRICMLSICLHSFNQNAYKMGQGIQEGKKPFNSVNSLFS